MAPRFGTSDIFRARQDGLAAGQPHALAAVAAVAVALLAGYFVLIHGLTRAAAEAAANTAAAKVAAAAAAVEAAAARAAGPKNFDELLEHTFRGKYTPAEVFDLAEPELATLLCPPIPCLCTGVPFA